MIETVGEKKEKEVREAIDKDRVTNNPPADGEIISTGQGRYIMHGRLEWSIFLFRHRGSA